MKLYKGFKKDLTCRGFQFKKGKTYIHEGDVKLCKSGFHACEIPLDCLKYYNIASSVFHEVEMDGVTEERGDESKRVGKIIKIGARLNLRKLVSLSVDYYKEKVKGSPAAISEFRSTAAASGDGSTAATSGYGSTAATSGNKSTAATSGDESTAATSGDKSTAATSGYGSTAAASGDKSTAAASGNKSTAATSGDKSTAAASGDGSTAIVKGKDSVAVVTGTDSKAKGALGCWLVLTERGKWNGETYPIIEVRAVKVDGETIKPDTFYELKGGEIKEWEE